LCLLLGWRENGPLPIVKEPSDLKAHNLDVAITENVSIGMCEGLSREGYSQQRRFVLLPSRRNLRWLLPHVSKRRGIDGLQLYTPYGNIARILKTLIVQARATGWAGWMRDSILIASRTALPIETLLCEVTGEKRLVLSLSLGTPGAFQKLTVQVMHPAGSILGYLKMPMTEAAGERLRHEATIVRDLSLYSELRPHIPRLLFAGLLGDQYLVLQSALEGRPGPVRYTAPHERFQERLQRCQSAQRTGLCVVEETGQEWDRVAPRMGAKWQTMGREALGIAMRELSGRAVPCGIQHGDFAPWNTRLDNGDLGLFDWEAASRNAPLLWDQFHFVTQVECLLKVRQKLESPRDGRKGNRGLYLLYLLSTAGEFWEKGAPDVAIRYREEQLLRFMSMNSWAA
jgi:hypothetical protein